VKVVELPLHYGKIPPWLMSRMIKLAREISEIIILEFGTKKFLKFLSDPIWFQSFSCVLGFDWHSSGSTTATLYALKQALKGIDEIQVFGGKGKHSLKTLEEIDKSKLREKGKFKKISRLCAKVDNALLQDGYSLYIHSLIVDEKGNWVVVQQGMNPVNQYARRYHWSIFDLKDWFEEPHSNIIGSKREEWVIDLTSRKSRETRKTIYDLATEDPRKIEREFRTLKMILKGQKRLFEKDTYLIFPKNHRIKIPKKIFQVLSKINKHSPKDFEELFMIKGFGSSIIRALALISHLIYGTELSFEDPLLFSFAHGGKDGFPFFVKKRVYDKSIQVLEDILQDLKLGKKEKIRILERLKEI